MIGKNVSNGWKTFRGNKKDKFGWTKRPDNESLEDVPASSLHVYDAESFYNNSDNFFVNNNRFYNGSLTA